MSRLLLWRHHKVGLDDGRMHRLLHHRRCISDIWYRCTYRSLRRAVVIMDARRVKRYFGDYRTNRLLRYQFTRRPTRRWPQLQCSGQLSQRWTLPMSLSLTSCIVEQRRREHGVASTYFLIRWTATYFRAYSITTSSKYGD